MQKITPFLWYNDNAEEAMNLYVSISRTRGSSTFTATARQARVPRDRSCRAPSRASGSWRRTGGPQFTFSPAISLFVSCEPQEEVDELWEKLSEGGEKQHCGWLKDKFGVSWQIIPTALGEMLFDKDPRPEKSSRVMKAILKWQDRDPRLAASL